MTHRILAIDDEPHMLRLLERIIVDKTPYAITTLSNSLELPDLLAEHTFDLIITDLRMPGMDGLDVLHYVREHDRPEEVIIMTAFGSLDSALQALQQGVFDYITKPFKKEQIIFAVDRAMRWQKARRAADRMSSVFEREPFDAALAKFRDEYVARLAEETNGDVEMIAGRSGLESGMIAEILDRLKPGRTGRNS